jgi:hypothetical protein
MNGNSMEWQWQHEGCSCPLLTSQVTEPELWLTK